MEISVDTNLIRISDGTTEYFGADQEWFSSHWHRLSGCGPTTAALITMYMAAAFPEPCAALYRFALPARKDEFAVHMAKVREFVTPGAMGLTDPKEFARGALAFSQRCGVSIVAQQIPPRLSAGVAFGFFKQALRHGYLPALLLLRNPSPELSDFTWHWMAAVGCDDEKRTLTVSTYGKRFEINFERAWVQHKPYYAAGVYFYPD
jgi:hypothetical protein